MIKIDYPAYKPLIKKENGKEIIFDPFRKKWILLTPEEWVRQHFLQYLTRTLLFPAALIAIEKQLLLGEMKKRFDIVLYNKNARPWMVVECKEMKLALTEKVWQQVLRYNSNLQATFLVITNGSFCRAFKKEGNSFIELDVMPMLE